MTAPLRPARGPGRRGPGWFATGARGAVVAVSAIVLGLQVWASGPGSPMTVAAAGISPLTCFAVDVSGSNLVASGGEPPSDPGPVFVRQQVIELFSQVLADLGEATGQQVGVVTFGTGPGTRIGPLVISAPAARSELATALPTALRPSSAEAAWTDWAAGVAGCEQMFKRSGDTHGMVVLLTDGFPQGPAGGPAAQLAAIAPMARHLWADGITIQPVLYGAGAGAGQPGPARQAMTRLAALGHGQLVLAASPLDMLHAALSLASLSTGLPLGGSEFPVNGSTTVPMDVAPRVAAAVLVVLRSSSQLQISVGAPSGKTLASAGAGTPGLGLVAALTRPAAGSYQASADGQGSVFAAELLRYVAVAAPSAAPSATPRPGPAGPGRPPGRGPGRAAGCSGWSWPWWSWRWSASPAGASPRSGGPRAPWWCGGGRLPACSTRPTSTGWCGWRISSTRAANPPAGPSAGLAGPRSRSVPRVRPSAWLPARPGLCPPCRRPRSPGSPMAPTVPCLTSRRDGPPAPGPSLERLASGPLTLA